MNQSNKSLDPSKVKAGDTVTLERGKAVVTDEVTETVPFRSDAGGVKFTLSQDMPMEPRRIVGIPQGWTLTAHQPAPAPEPEPAYEPGDMAAVTARGWINGWSVRTQTNDGWASHSDSDDVRSDAEVESVVPLVVINPATVDWRGLQSQMSVLVVGADPFKRAGDILGVVRRELGIEAS